MTLRVRQRTRAYKRGQHAETIAAWWLRAKGFRILATRWRCPRGEIDLIARRRRLVIFVEVKARRNSQDAATAITPRQQTRIAAAAEAYTARAHFMHNNPEAWRLRFDALLISPRRLPRHIRDAWRID